MAAHPGDLPSEKLTFLGAAVISLAVHLLLFVFDPAGALGADGGSPSAHCGFGLLLLFLAGLCLLTLRAWMAPATAALVGAILAGLGIGLPGLCLHLVGVVELAEGLGGFALFFLFLVGISLVMLSASIGDGLGGRRRRMLGIWSIGLISLILRFTDALFVREEGDPRASALPTGDLSLFLFVMGTYLVTLHEWIAVDRRRRARSMLGLLGMGFLCLALHLVVFNPADGLGADNTRSTIRGFGLFLLLLVGVGLVMLRVCMADDHRNNHDDLPGEFVQPEFAADLW